MNFDVLYYYTEGVCDVIARRKSFSILMTASPSKID